MILLKPLPTFVVVAMAVALENPVQTAQNAPVFRSHVTAVSLDVSVRSGNRPVTGLAVADFAVTDNGVPQAVERAFTDLMPIDVTVIIDASGSTTSVFDEIRRNSQQILAMLRPDDRARVLVIETTPYQLLPLQTVDQGLTLPKEKVPGHLSSIYDAILAGLVSRPDPDRRRLQVVITDGVDTKSVTSLQMLESVTRRTEAVLHVISVLPKAQKPGTSPPMRTTSEGFVRGEPTKSELEAFERLPTLTGGAFHGAGHDRRWGQNIDAVAAVRDLIEEFRQSYVVQYTPSNVDAGGWHNVVVRIRGIDPQGVRVRAGYFDTVTP